MTRLSLVVSLALSAIVVAVAPAHAQIAAAIGQPLPSPDLEAGVVSVRVIAGSPSKPIVGTDVTLMVNGTPRQARTDSAGRAIFKDLPVGATVKASVVDEDKKTDESSEFQLADTGVRVMLSTKPFEAGGGGAPFAGGAGGMPEPRQLSGQPRPEQSDAPGMITVRLTYDDFADPTPPAGVIVLLAGYHADDTVDVRAVATDKAGRAQFTGLDIKGETSYFAMAELPRNGAIDRLASLPCVLDARTGVRMVLAADKRDSKDPPVDDLGKLEKQDRAPADAKVRVTLLGVPESSAHVQLVAMTAGGQRRVVGAVDATRAAPDPSDVVGESQPFQLNPNVAAHTVHVQVHGGAGVDQPIGGVKIVLVPAKQKEASKDPGVLTPEGGEIEITNNSDEPLVAEVTINGKVMRSAPFDLSKGGGVLDISAQWEAQGKLIAEFDASSVKPDEVVFAESQMRGVSYRSAPLQMVPGRGASSTLYIFPRVMFSFSWTSRVDDEFLAVQGLFEITNNSWAPYVGGPDGMVIPVPAHFRGANVAEQDQGSVAVAQGEGFRIARPIPPGGKTFHAAFSLPVVDGTVHWSLDLPLGAFESGMQILETPGMNVQTPPSVHGDVETSPQGGTFFVLRSISILPKQSMTMTISNLPTQPPWRVWAPRIVGFFTILLMLVGVGLAVARTSAARALHVERAAKREKLLDELVALEPGSKHDKRRAQITEELEKLWDE